MITVHNKLAAVSGCNQLFQWHEKSRLINLPYRREMDNIVSRAIRLKLEDDNSPKKKGNMLKRKHSPSAGEKSLSPPKKMKGLTKENTEKTTVQASKQTKTDIQKEKRPYRRKNVPSSPDEVAGRPKNSVSWKIHEVISSNLSVPEWASKNVVRLLDEGCTIPFIARYRKEQTGGMEVENLRETLQMMQDLRAVEARVIVVKKAIRDKEKMTKQLNDALSNAQSMTEVECLYAPFNPGNKGSLAERAKELGLEPLAMSAMRGVVTEMDLLRYVDKDKEGLCTMEKVSEGVKHIVADVIHKDTKVMETIRELSKHESICLRSKQNTSTKVTNQPGEKPENPEKYHLYFDSNLYINRAQPHQILAINRGEKHKILSVKVVFQPFLFEIIKRVGRCRWMHNGMNWLSNKLIEESIDDACRRLIEPQLSRLVRSSLTKMAEKSSIEVFASNLKYLLLTAPLKGNTILAIDPGFTNGCKTAIITKTGQVATTEIIYMHDRRSNKTIEKSKLIELIEKYKCDVIGIGNGVACRETETFVSDVIQTSFPHLKYCIVSESGASIYSVSDIAKKELPGLDPSLRGAVSIGRRLLDPLAEYVKLDPKHLGVGQYQHDMPEKQLKVSLDSIVEECVSFVGVDINTCTNCILSRVAGLSEAKAKKIIEHRESIGVFTSREQLLSVKGLGAKTYEQAAGFVRIHPKRGQPALSIDTTVKEEPGQKKKKKTTKSISPGDPKYNPLDMTWIHPESYELTHSLLKSMKLNAYDLGNPEFIDTVKTYLQTHSIKSLAEQFICGQPTVQLITDALLLPLSYDLRDEFDKPLFRKSVLSIEDLKTDEVVTGKVTNVTHFGAFVDIGVGVDALIHISNMVLKDTNRRCQLKLGDKVEGHIKTVDVKLKRIGVALNKVL